MALLYTGPKHIQNTFMKRKTVKQILLWGGSIFLCLTVVLAVHIYMVTRPKAPDAHTRIMARIDIKQPLSQQDADKISSWMYQQQGVDRVMVNPQSRIVVFTFFPVKTSATDIVHNFKMALHYPGDRYLPGAEEMKQGCPAMGASFASKITSIVKYIF